MRARNLILGAIVAGAMLGSAACGGNEVTIRPAGGSTAPTSDVTTSGRTTTAVGAAAERGSGAGFSVGPNGVTVGDGSGAGYSIGPDGTVTVGDGRGNGYTAGPGGVTVKTREHDPNAGADASDLVVFCGQAARFGTANVELAKSFPGDAATFAASLTTMHDAVLQMKRTGPSAVQTDLTTLGSAVAEIQAAFDRNGGDLTRLGAEGSVAGVSSAAQGAFDRVDVVTVDACG
jgi:hypothetical protein